MTISEKLAAITDKGRQYGHIEYDGRAWHITSNYIVEIPAATVPLGLKKTSDPTKPLLLALEHMEEITPMGCLYFEHAGVTARRFSGNRFVNEVYFRLFPEESKFFTTLSQYSSISVRLNGQQIGMVMPILVDEGEGTPCDAPEEAVLFPDESTMIGKRLIELRKELKKAEEDLEDAEDKVGECEDAIVEIQAEIRKLEKGGAA